MKQYEAHVYSVTGPREEHTHTHEIRSGVWDSTWRCQHPTEFPRSPPCLRKRNHPQSQGSTLVTHWHVYKPLWMQWMRFATSLCSPSKPRRFVEKCRTTSTQASYNKKPTNLKLNKVIWKIRLLPAGHCPPLLDPAAASASRWTVRATRRAQRERLVHSHRCDVKLLFPRRI